MSSLLIHFFPTVKSFDLRLFFFFLTCPCGKVNSVHTYQNKIITEVLIITRTSDAVYECNFDDIERQKRAGRRKVEIKSILHDNLADTTA